MTNCVPVLTQSGRHVLRGTLPEPRHSTATQGWRGVFLEYFTGDSTDVTAVFENHGIALFLNGCVNLYQRYEGRVVHAPMRRGNITISPAGAAKSFQHEGGGDFLVVHIAPNLLLRIAEDIKLANPDNVKLLHNFCTRDAQIERLALQLWAEYRTEDLAAGICAESLANQLAVHLLRNYSTLGKMAEAPSSKLSAKTLKRAVDYIEANLTNDLTVHEVARVLSMSVGHFAHAFKCSTGTAPHHYVVERRVETAKDLLRETDLPIANVATQVGFSTHSHFCVAFRKLTAESPNTFRRKQ